MATRSTGRAFTLVELMIVVAIIAVLAAIAIPVFANTITRARFSEAAINVDGIRTAAVANEDNLGPGLTTMVNPIGIPSKTPQAWETGVLGWDQLDWRPDGAVRCVYLYSFDTNPLVRHEVDVQCDVDGDGNMLTVQTQYAPSDPTNDSWIAACQDASGGMPWNSSNTSTDGWIRVPMGCH